MDEMDILNYRPDLEWDEREVTAFQEPEIETTELETEEGRTGRQLPVSSLLEDYDQLKEDMKERIEEHEKKLEDLKLDEDIYTQRALEETGHVSKFRPLDFKELFQQKESSPGAYLIGVLENRIEEEDGDLNWEVYIEYLELIEELRVLDYYIEQIIYPIFGFSPDNIEPLERLKELEREWFEKRNAIHKEYQEVNKEYTKALYTDPDAIPVLRDRLHQIEKERTVYRQGNNQLYSSVLTVQNKIGLVKNHLRRIDEILDMHIEKEPLVEEFLKASENDEEALEALKQNAVMLKQSIDADNKKKKDLKETRRNLYSEGKQKRIIEEYGTVNRLYRESVLPSIHYMKTYQDNRSDLLDETFNASAKSLWSNHLENREKTYETYLIQISTSQIRNERLSYLRNKEKSRTLFNYLYDVYKEMK